MMDIDRARRYKRAKAARLARQEVSKMHLDEYWKLYEDYKQRLGVSNLEKEKK